MFMVQIVGAIEKVAMIDPKRVYMTGISNGAELSYATGCMNPDVFSGISPNSGGTLGGTECNTLSKPLADIQFDDTPDFAFSDSQSSVTNLAKVDNCKSGPTAWKTFDSTTTDPVCLKNPDDNATTLVPCNTHHAGGEAYDLPDLGPVRRWREGRLLHGRRGHPPRRCQRRDRWAHHLREQHEPEHAVGRLALLQRCLLKEQLAPPRSRPRCPSGHSRRSRCRNEGPLRCAANTSTELEAAGASRPRDAREPSTPRRRRGLNLGPLARLLGFRLRRAQLASTRTSGATRRSPSSRRVRSACS